MTGRARAARSVAARRAAWKTWAGLSSSWTCGRLLCFRSSLLRRRLHPLSTARAARPRRGQHAKGTAAPGRARVVRERTAAGAHGGWEGDGDTGFAGCKELAFCKTLASAGKGCAGPELVQWQELLSTRVRLGLPQVRRFVVAVVEHRFGSLAEICDLLSGPCELCLVGWQLHRCDGSPVRRWRCSPSRGPTTATTATSTAATGPRRASATATRCATGWLNTARCLAGSARRGRAPARAPTRGGGDSDARHRVA